MKKLLFITLLALSPLFAEANIAEANMTLHLNAPDGIPTKVIMEGDNGAQLTAFGDGSNTFIFNQAYSQAYANALFVWVYIEPQDPIPHTINCPDAIKRFWPEEGITVPVLYPGEEVTCSFNLAVSEEETPAPEPEEETPTPEPEEETPTPVISTPESEVTPVGTVAPEQNIQEITELREKINLLLQMIELLRHIIQLQEKLL